MKKKMFHTQTERKDNYEIRYIAGEDFVEMGSISGEQYLSAIQFCKLYEKSYSRELMKDDLEFVIGRLNNFVEKYGFDISQKYPHHSVPAVEFYQKFGWNKYDSMLVTVFSDYSNIWVRIEEVSHQNFHPEYHNSIIINSSLLLHGFEKFVKLSKEYRTESFYGKEKEGDYRD
jgi:hypothetical protein